MAKMKSDVPVDYAAFQFQLSPKYSREACRKFKSLNESSHGKNYDRYMQRRDAKLREEWSAYREEMKQMRDAKLMEEWSTCSEEMKALKFSRANKATHSQVKSYARSRSSNDAALVSHSSNQMETGAALMRKKLGAAVGKENSKISGANKATRSQVKSYARSRSSNDALNQIETGAARMRKNLGAAEKGMTRGIKGLFKFEKKKPEGNENTSISIGRFSRLLSIR